MVVGPGWLYKNGRYFKTVGSFISIVISTNGTTTSWISRCKKLLIQSLDYALCQESLEIDWHKPNRLDTSLDATTSIKISPDKIFWWQKSSTDKFLKCNYVNTRIWSVMFVIRVIARLPCICISDNY